MNQGGYFGAYRGGFKTLPDDAYNMMTAPTRQNAETIGKVASGIGGIAQQYMGQKAADQAFQQGSAAQYSGLESMSQATGVPMNAELANQYANMGGMSPQQQAVFQNSLGQEAQRMQMLYGINQAQARAAQAQQGMNYQSLGQSLDVDPYTPPSFPTMQGGQGVMPVSQNQIAPSLLPSYPSLLVPGYGGRTGPLRPMNQR